MPPKAAKKQRARKPKAETAPPAPPPCEPICEECRRIRDIELGAIKRLERALANIGDAIMCIKGHGHGNAYQYLTGALTEISPPHADMERLYRKAEEKRREKQ